MIVVLLNRPPLNQLVNLLHQPHRFLDRHHDLLVVLDVIAGEPAVAR
jgi:hypothetical protein